MNDRLVTSGKSETDVFEAAIRIARSMDTPDDTEFAAAETPPVFHPRQDRVRALKATALVLLVGPPAGSLVLSASAAVSGIADNVTRSSIIADLPQAIAGWLALSLFLAIFSYVYGIVPALLSCIWLGWRIYRNGTVGMMEAICTAAAATIICALVISIVAQDFPKGVIAWLLICGPAAIFSAFVCRRLLSTFGILPLSLPEASA